MIRKILSYACIFYHWKLKKSSIVPYMPEDISIELTNQCNFSCVFCLQSSPEHFDRVARSTLSKENAAVLLTKLRQAGVRTDVMHWTLDGEPFLNKNIYDICLLAIHHNWSHFIFSTNGYFATPENLNKLPVPDRKITYTLCIDYCSDQQLFEKDRGVSGSWEKIRNNIMHCLENNELEHIQIQLTDISSFSLEDIGELKSRFAALQSMFPASDRLTVSSRIFHNATGFIAGITEKKRTTGERYNLCPYPWTSLVIASNGDVVACCRDLEHKTVLGNLLTQELAAIWNGKKYQQCRQALAERNPQVLGACAHCDLPWDKGKFTLSHLMKTAINRLGIFR